ncbi:hypothetical protein OH687_21425 [Burkholderia anthina]|nr:hypothetical protein OH687_21425 [Burkholderia anthina]
MTRTCEANGSPSAAYATRVVSGDTDSISANAVSETDVRTAGVDSVRKKVGSFMLNAP